MQIYFSLVLSSILLSFLIYIFKFRMYKYICFIFILLISILVPAFRDLMTGTDSAMYVSFLNYNYHTVSEWLKLIEPANAFIYHMYKEYGFNNYGHIFLIYSIITNVFMFLGVFQISRNIPISLSILFMFNCLYFMQINIMRQAVAVAISLYAFKYILSNQLKKYYLFIVLAILFHSSAFICFLFPLIRYGVKRNFLIFSLVSVVFILSLSFISDFIIHLLVSSGDIFGKYEHYISGKNDEGTGKKMFFLDVIVIFSILLVSNTKKLLKNEDFKLLFYLILILLSILFSIAFLGLDARGIGRIHYYFYIGLIFGFPYIFENINKQYRPLVYVLFISFLFINFYMYLYLFHYSGYLPYIINKDFF